MIFFQKENINSFDVTSVFLYPLPEVICNKAKGRISKRVLQENRARQIFRKTNISYSMIRTGTGVRNVRFSENLARFVLL